MPGIPPGQYRRGNLPPGIEQGWEREIKLVSSTLRHLNMRVHVRGFQAWQFSFYILRLDVGQDHHERATIKSICYHLAGARRLTNGIIVFMEL